MSSISRRRFPAPQTACLLALLLLAFSTASPCALADGQVYLQSVEFTGGYRCADLGELVPVPEMLAHFTSDHQYVVERNWPRAYLKGSSITLKLTFALHGTGSYSGYVMLSGYCGPMTPLYGFYSLSFSPSSFSINLGSNGTQTVETTLTGMPNYVCAAPISLYTLFAPTPPMGYHFVSLFSVYEVLAAPLEPMEQPWVQVLADACGWARYDTTAADTARDVTTGLFFAQRFAYPEDTASHWTTDDGTVFRLTQYYNTSGWVSGNCVDVSDFLTICLRSLGLDFQVRQYESDPSDFFPDVGPDGEDVTGFKSIPVCLIGSDPNWLTYASSYWAWHQIAFSASGTVYDVCAAHAKDLNGNGYHNPPINWPLSGYWQTAPLNYIGLVDIPRTSTPSPLTGLFWPDVE